ncbi:MAG: 4Fe-4S dicluster domain-containing protein, partial [Bacteroidota bacterium]
MDLKQILFIISLLITLGVFSFSMNRIIRFLKLTRAGFPIKNIGERLKVTWNVAIAQTKIFRNPIAGFFHAMVFWGFIIITIGSIEMVVDGIAGKERLFAAAGPVYDVIIGLGDAFAAFIVFAILVFLARRLFLDIQRFKGVEMKKKSKLDANIALTFILLLMISLIGMNAAYVALHGGGYEGVFPVSAWLAGFMVNMDSHSLHVVHEAGWWSHILLIFIFANVLPYSKHFHVFMSVPNVFLSRLEPLGYVRNMKEITEEVKLMMDPDAAFSEPETSEEPEEQATFGAKDVDDLIWKNYFDSLACTECGRCTAVCPANITGKLLSPRKIMVDTRARMKEKGPGLLKDENYDDGKSLLRDYITEEELWACTMCNACAQECPININQPSIILELRRYLVMEEAAAPSELNAMFTNIENNGAPWQYPQEDRMKWA